MLLDLTMVLANGCATAAEKRRTLPGGATVPNPILLFCGISSLRDFS